MKRANTVGEFRIAIENGNEAVLTFDDVTFAHEGDAIVINGIRFSDPDILNDWAYAFRAAAIKQMANFIRA